MRSSVPDKSRAALERLIQIAQGDTGQSRIVANFLLAWWNAGAAEASERKETL